MFFLNDVPPVSYTDPWQATFEERFAALLKGQRRVAYFYDHTDNSTFRYRAYNMIQVLRTSGNETSAAYFTLDDQDSLGKVVDVADVLVVCRARYTETINRMISTARNKGKRVFFDIDDLVFDTAYLHLVLDTLDQHLGRSEDWDFWFGAFARLGATLNLCDGAITTNEYLAAQIQGYSKKPVFIIPNFLNREQMEISRRIFQGKQSSGFKRTDEIHLGYFSGTPSHNKDLEIVADALATLLRKDPRVRILIVGFMDKKGPLQDFGSRIDHWALHDFVNLQRLIGLVEVNLMPLQENHFTNCKSELKYFEAGIVGTVSVASPVFTYARAIQDGENGYLARSFEWYEKLELVLDSLESDMCYATMAEKAFLDSEQKYAWYNQIDLIERVLFSAPLLPSSESPGIGAMPPNLCTSPSLVSPFNAGLHFEPTKPPSPLDRRGKLLSRIRPEAQDGLEIGPLSHPIVGKAESNGRVRYVDYATMQELKDKYRNDPMVAVNEIVEVDYLWGERTLQELVGDKRFDYVIASHVIEHVPDLLGWLKEVAEVLKEKGILALAIPDKRYTFDYLRELSTPGMLIEDHLLHKRRPGPREVFDHVALMSKVDVTAAWEGTIDKANLSHYSTLQDALHLAKDSLGSERYHDVHTNVFTPASFFDLLEIASRLELCDFVVTDLYDTARNTIEFILSLERLSRDEKREDALTRQLAGIDRARDQLAYLDADWAASFKAVQRGHSEVPSLLDRRSKLLSRIRPEAQDGLEIGPLSHPIVGKAESNGRVRYVDYATMQELKDKYRQDPLVNVNEIVEVDYLWGERSLQELVGGKRFDYVIASHVIEDVPDLLGWLKEIAEVLKDKGILVLAIPDKRYTFDYLRELSTPGMLIEDYLRHKRRPGPREIFDYVALTSKVDVTAAWEGTLDKAGMWRLIRLQEAFRLAQDNFSAAHYFDAHVNVFTPASFLDLLEIAGRLELCDFVVADMYDTAPNTIEFILSLERLGRVENREEALKRQLVTIASARQSIR